MRSRVLALLVPIAVVGGCGCESYTWDKAYIDAETCRAIEAGADCMDSCHAEHSDVEYQSCELDNRNDCADAWVDLETTESACK